MYCRCESAVPGPKGNNFHRETLSDTGEVSTGCVHFSSVAHARSTPASFFLVWDSNRKEEEEEEEESSCPQIWCVLEM